MTAITEYTFFIKNSSIRNSTENFGNQANYRHFCRKESLNLTP